MSASISICLFQIDADHYRQDEFFWECLHQHVLKKQKKTTSQSETVLKYVLIKILPANNQFFQLTECG